MYLAKGMKQGRLRILGVRIVSAIAQRKGDGTTPPDPSSIQERCRLLFTRLRPRAVHKPGVLLGGWRDSRRVNLKC